MELDDKTPQNESRNPIAEISFLSLAETGDISRELDGFLAESGDVGSVETSPSSEEPSIARNRPGDDTGEEKMSQSYHEIFDSQAYLQAQAKAENQTHQAEIPTETPTQAGDKESTQEEKKITSPEEATRKETDMKNVETEKEDTDDPGPAAVGSGGVGEERHQGEEESPDDGEEESPEDGEGEGEDRVSSANSGNTETGQPFIPQGDVYLEDGQLISEDDSQASRDYLTNKLVADSIIWQQNYKATGGTGGGHNLSPDGEGQLLVPHHSPQRNETAHVMRHQEPQPMKSINSMADPVLLGTLEREARRLASDVDSVVENLACILQSISALTVETVETYRDGVCKTCDAVDDNIKGMYRLIARWEELNKSMSPCYKLSSEIKDIRKALDCFDASVAASGSKS